MRALENPNSFVTFVGHRLPDDTILFSELQIVVGSQRVTFDSISGITGLDAKVVQLAQDILENADKLSVQRQPFLCRIGNLQFEDYSSSTTDDLIVRVQLRLTKGKIVDFFAQDTGTNSLPELVDVFLPLTNLAAYLRAVGDTPYGSPGPQALHLTADRIDEFLLIYGGRLLDQAHKEPSPHHALV